MSKKEWLPKGAVFDGDFIVGYTQDHHIQFVEDMRKAGLKPYNYRGRNFYEGPAVNVDDLQEGLSATKVSCQWDHMGKGWVVYPKQPITEENNDA